MHPLAALLGHSAQFTDSLPPTLGSHWTPETTGLLLWGWEFDIKGPFALEVIRLSLFPLKFARCYFRVPLGWCWHRCRPEGSGSAWIPAWWLSIPMYGRVQELMGCWSLENCLALLGSVPLSNWTLNVPPGPNFNIGPVLFSPVQVVVESLPAHSATSQRPTPLFKLSTSAPVLRNREISFLLFIEFEENLLWRAVLCVDLCPCGETHPIQQPGSRQWWKPMSRSILWKTLIKIRDFLLGKSQSWS